MPAFALDQLISEAAAAQPRVLASASADTSPDVVPPARTPCGEPVYPRMLARSISGHVRATKLIVRAGPSMTCPQTFRLVKGTPVEILRCDEESRWCYVMAVPGNNSEVSGWVSARYIERGRAPDPAISLMLEDYESYFAEGDLAGLSKLYTANARENNLTGRKKILQDYQQYFNYTRSRHLEVEVSNIEQQDEFNAAIDGVIVTERKDVEDGRWYRGRSNFKLTVVKTESSYKITAFDWHLVEESTSHKRAAYY
ncbi:MAG: SH3 domain-containing protein [Gammaproteobacteria bacterium]|nr:SH3 domain-containing protein [Gammaproteobacteria bacterium]